MNKAKTLEVICPSVQKNKSNKAAENWNVTQPAGSTFGQGQKAPTLPIPRHVMVMMMRVTLMIWRKAVRSLHVAPNLLLFSPGLRSLVTWLSG